METKYTRRELLGKFSRTAAGIFYLTSPLSALASTPEKTIEVISQKASNLSYPYEVPTSRKDLESIPENHLLARTIFGEGRGCPTVHEKIAIGYTAINRLYDNKSFNGQNSLREVLLMQTRKKNGSLDDQYDCFFDRSKNLYILENFQKVLDPQKYEPEKWEESLALADLVIEGKLDSFNKGQTIFVEKNTVRKRREKVKKMKEKGEEITKIWLDRVSQVDLEYHDENKIQHYFFV